MQMWSDLVAVGVDQEKIDQQPNAVLWEFWKQLRPEQQFQENPKGKSGKARPVTLQQFM